MENQIIELEKKYWEAMQTHNYETVKSLTHFPCIVAGRNGVKSVDEINFKKMFESGKDKKMRVLSFSGFETQKLNENTIITGYEMELEYPADENSTVAKCACSSTWVKENENWVCALHSETELKK
jgi:hypothetical protein